jgi:L-alanine-DL-glutamate epimerase-like enolase superfamily enzyme
LKITAIRDGVVPIRSEIRNAYISFAELTASIVAIESDLVRNGCRLTGYGFNSNGRYAQSGLLRERFIPRLERARPEEVLADDGSNFDPAKAWRILMANEKPGGHGERSVAVGVLDMALWDLVAKIEDKPLYRLLADRYRGGQAEDSVYVYAAGGYYYPGKDIPMLREEMRRYLDLGYQTVKIKIGGAPLAEDIGRVEAVLAMLPAGGLLAVDANGRFDLETALAYAKALNQYSLKWYEEAGDPLDFEINREVAAVSTNPVATGENLFSRQDARNLIRYGGMRPDRDFLQMDPALSYGLVEHLRMVGMLGAHGWSPRQCIPHGGHQFALHIAAGLALHGNESYPDVFQPFGGFADNVPVEGGRMRIPDAPGIGIERKQGLFEAFATL